MLSVELKGKSIRLGIKAIITIEKRFGKAISQIDMENLSFEDVAFILYAGSNEPQKDFTKFIDELDELCTIGEAMEAVIKAVNLSFTGKEKPEIDEKNG